MSFKTHIVRLEESRTCLSGAPTRSHAARCSCGWASAEHANKETAIDGWLLHAHDTGTEIRPAFKERQAALVRARLAKHHEQPHAARNTIDWTAIDRRADLQRELAKRAIAWVLADRAADDCSAALSRIEDAADEIKQRVGKGQDPTAEDHALLGKLEYEKIGFQIADQRAQACDEEFRQAAKKLVEDLEGAPAGTRSTDL